MSGKTCSLGHCIDPDLLIYLHNVVLTCGCCETQLRFKTLLSVYEKDVYNEREELFHLYQFLQRPVCLSCGATLGSIFTVCDPEADNTQAWKDAVERGVMPSGFTKN